VPISEINTTGNQQQVIILHPKPISDDIGSHNGSTILDRKHV